MPALASNRRSRAGDDNQCHRCADALVLVSADIVAGESGPVFVHDLSLSPFIRWRGAKGTRVPGHQLRCDSVRVRLERRSARVSCTRACCPAYPGRTAAPAWTAGRSHIQSCRASSFERSALMAPEPCGYIVRVILAATLDSRREPARKFTPADRWSLLPFDALPRSRRRGLRPTKQ
jgi:hypothetical protein